MSREGAQLGTAYLLTWPRDGHSAVLIENAAQSEGYYISFYPGDNIRGPIDSALVQSSSRSSTRSSGSTSRSTSGFGFKEGGFKTLSFDTGAGAPHACDKVSGLDYHGMVAAMTAARNRNYGLFSCNCADVAESVLRAGGLNLDRDVMVSAPSSLRARVARAVTEGRPPAVGAAAPALPALAREVLNEELGIPAPEVKRLITLSESGSLRVPIRGAEISYKAAYASEVEPHAYPSSRFSSLTSSYSSPSSAANSAPATVVPIGAPSTASAATPSAHIAGTDVAGGGVGPLSDPTPAPPHGVDDSMAVPVPISPRPLASSPSLAENPAQLDTALHGSSTAQAMGTGELASNAAELNLAADGHTTPAAEDSSAASVPKSPEVE